MKQAIVITPTVINTLRSLPMEERLNVASALTGEILLGEGIATDLPPMESMIYEILRSYVHQASASYNTSR